MQERADAARAEVEDANLAYHDALNRRVKAGSLMLAAQRAAAAGPDVWRNVLHAEIEAHACAV